MSLNDEISTYLLQMRDKEECTAAVFGLPTQLMFAKEISAAMKYLESKHITHGNLCAYTTLLSEKMVCKLSAIGHGQSSRLKGTSILLYV